MENRRIQIYLFLSIFVMTVVPLAVSLYFLDHTLETTFRLGFNPQVLEVLESSSQNLKILKKADPSNQLSYKQQFQNLENLKEIYAHSDMVHSSFLVASKIYFIFGLIVAIFFSALIATFLSRKISKSYQATFAELFEEKSKVRYLQEMSSWQELAKMLAHEIQNPLTPIRMMMSTLETSYRTQAPEQFQKTLAESQQIVQEEVDQLIGIVDRFREFSTMPQIKMEKESLSLFSQNLRRYVHETYPDTEFLFDKQLFLDEVFVQIDSVLLRQVFANIIKNGIQANPQQKISFTIEMSHEENTFQIQISNNGALVAEDIVPRIFDPYVSSYQSKNNMGLGLAIVKKIMIEHGGFIRYEVLNLRPTFLLEIQRFE